MGRIEWVQESSFQIVFFCACTIFLLFCSFLRFLYFCKNLSDWYFFFSCIQNYCSLYQGEFTFCFDYSSSYYLVGVSVSRLDPYVDALIRCIFFQTSPEHQTYYISYVMSLAVFLRSVCNWAFLKQLFYYFSTWYLHWFLSQKPQSHPCPPPSPFSTSGSTDTSLTKATIICYLTYSNSV